MSFDPAFTGIFDSHAHYFDKRFDREYEGGAEALLGTICPEPVAFILNVGTNLENAQEVLLQSKKHKGMYSAIGIHPEDCHVYADEAAALSELEALLKDPKSREVSKLVALGEIGLDYHTEEFIEGKLDKAKEMRFFEAQLELAKKYDLPVIIHDRDAHGDCFETILKHPGVRGVFHSYSGSAEMAKDLVRRGFYISFSGTLTFRNATSVRAAALAVPHERLLVETDAPYLAPHPYRGSLNHSGLLVETLGILAGLWQCSPNEAAKITADNAKRLFFGEKSV